MTCTKCKGSGVVDGMKSIDKLKYQPRICPTCNGTGQIEVKKERV